MGSAAQRIISTLVATVVFVASINCVCHAAPVAQAQSTHRAVKSCCADKGNGQQDNSDGSRQNAPCIHCQRSLMNDSVSAKQLSQQLDFSHYVPASACPTSALMRDWMSTAASWGDLPPPVSASTLLSLHCALTT